MDFLLFGITFFLLLWIAFQLRVLFRNYHAACATGLCIVICPYDPDSVSPSLLDIWPSKGEAYSVHHSDL
jgi:hypothetical protein